MPRVADVGRVDLSPFTPEQQNTLDDMQGNAQDAVDDLQTALEFPFGRPLPVDEDVQAKWGELPRADTALADITVTLPATGPDFYGRPFVVEKSSTLNDLTVIPDDLNALIDGAASVSIAAASRGSITLISLDETNWTRV